MFFSCIVKYSAANFFISCCILKLYLLLKATLASSKINESSAFDKNSFRKIPEKSSHPQKYIPQRFLWQVICILDIYCISLTDTFVHYDNDDNNDNNYEPIYTWLPKSFCTLTM